MNSIDGMNAPRCRGSCASVITSWLEATGTFNAAFTSRSRFGSASGLASQSPPSYFTRYSHSFAPTRDPNGEPAAVGPTPTPLGNPSGPPGPIPPPLPMPANPTESSASATVDPVPSVICPCRCAASRSISPSVLNCRANSAFGLAPPRLPLRRRPRRIPRRGRILITSGGFSFSPLGPRPLARATQHPLRRAQRDLVPAAPQNPQRPIMPASAHLQQRRQDQQHVRCHRHRHHVPQRVILPPAPQPRPLPRRRPPRPSHPHQAPPPPSPAPAPHHAEM